MPGSEGLVSCVGGCNSTIFKSQRVHRPLVELQPNIHLNAPSQLKEKQAKYGKGIGPTTSLPPICQYVPMVKKSRKRRDRKASGAGLPQNSSIEIEDDSDSDNEENIKRPRRSLAVQFMFWFCGIVIVVIGVGALVYAIVIVCTSMDKLTKVMNSQSTDTNTKLMRKFSGKRIGETAGNLAPWDTTFPPPRS